MKCFKTFPTATAVVAISRTNWSSPFPPAAIVNGFVPSAACLLLVGVKKGLVFVNDMPCERCHKTYQALKIKHYLISISNTYSNPKTYN